MKKLFITTLGCTKNLVDSEVMIAKLKNEYILTQNPEEADLLIVNSCGFINSAKEESLNTIFELHNIRKNNSTLVFSGCLTERYKTELQKELPEVDIFTGVGDYNQIDKLVKNRENKFSEKTFLISNEERIITGSISHAYIKISEGCNQKCSFCAIPKFKGKLQSRKLDFIIDEVKKLTKQGFYDFSFISQDSSAYLRDFNIKNGLIKLIDEIDKIEEVKSARILYLYPATTSSELIKRIANSKFHNYFDIPIQHISEKMLKIMKRGFGKEKTIKLLNEIKNIPNSFIRTSFIIGHPGETKKEFQELINFIENFRFDMINVFAYSNEEKTEAFNLIEKNPDFEVPPEEIERRVSILEKIIEKQRIENLKKLIGQKFKIILNNFSEEHEYLLSGKLIHWGEEIDGEIYVNDKADEVGELIFGKIYLAEITDLAGDYLLAKILSE